MPSASWDGGFLPSESEWEYAAVGGDQQQEYPWGWSDPGLTNQFEIYGRHFGNQILAPVGIATLGAGRWGQLDLAGEVEEWTLDWHADSYISPSVDGASLTPTPYRSVRGGDLPITLQGAGPYTITDVGGPTGRGDIVGFRCARP
jgi:formylglycine-generating enzyme required for sulfatase activity